MLLLILCGNQEGEGERVDAIVQFFQGYGLIGLFIISFIESFISPILPDLLLIPMSLASPGSAIYYSLITTAGSVLGGFIGYAVGNRWGLPALKRFVPPKHAATLRNWVYTYGGWAIFAAAMAPIPFKFVSITAGAFRVNLLIFLMASVLGRAKRFVLIGILIHYYGPMAQDIMEEYSRDFIVGSLVLAAAVGIVLYRRHKKKAAMY